jgi:hypothetical protein
MQFFKDGIGGGGPLEGLAVGVARGDEVVDALHEFFLTLVKDPRRMALSVISAKNRSTWLSQEL